MPVAIAAAIAALIPATGATLFTIGTGAAATAVTAASILGTGIAALASVGASFALNKLTAKKPQRPDPSINQLTVKQATPFRSRIYGRVKTGGAVFFEAANPAEHANLVIAQVICEGPIDAIEQYWLNDTFSTSTGGPNVALPWGALIAHESRLGTDTQTAGALYAGYGLSGQLKGLAWTGMTCVQPPIPVKQFQFFYPNGLPAIRTVVRGSLLYDPRDGVTRWTRNPALIALDYLTAYKMDASGTKVPRGMGIPIARINLDAFRAFANVCAGTVATKYQFDGSGNVSVAGGTEPRYLCDGQYYMDQAPTEVLSRILETCDAHLYTLADGTIGIRGGIWQTPTVTITNDMIISADFTQGNEKFAVVNELKIQITSPWLDYQTVEGEPYSDEDDQDINGVLAQDFTLPWVQSYSQARRLAKITMAKRNPRWRFNSLVCTLGALDALGEQFIHVTYSPGGVELIDEDFLVLNFKMVAGGDRMLCELQLASLSSDVYDWDADTEDRAPPTSGNVVDGPGPDGGGPSGGNG
jgi:hypothetical protein